MWWVKQSDGFRAWFAAQQGNGQLRAGLVAGDFVATIIGPTDAALTTATVSESTQKPGLYTFLVPSTFTLANGRGNYGVVIEIDTKVGPSGSPHVVGSMSSVLKVSAQDFDGEVFTRDTVLTSDGTGRPLTARRRVYASSTDANADLNHLYEVTVVATYSGLAADTLLRTLL